MIDKNFRLFGKISVVDIGFFAMVAVGIFLAQQFSMPQTIAARPDATQIRYTVEIPRRTAEFYEFVKATSIGDTVFDSVRGFEIGTIVDITKQPFTDAVHDVENDIIRLAIVDGLYFVYVVIEAHAQISDNATAIGQYEVMIGREAFLRTRYFAGGGFVVGLEHLWA